MSAVTRARRVAAALALTTILPSAASAQGTPAECFARFSSAVESIRGELAKLYGPGWSIAGIPRQIAHEIRALYYAEGRMERVIPGLAESRRRLDADGTRLVHYAEELEARAAAWQRRRAAWEREVAEWQADLNRLAARESEFERHPAVFPLPDQGVGDRRYECQGSPAECAPLYRLVEEFNAVRKRLAADSAELRRIEVEGDALMAELEAEAEQLPSREFALRERESELRGEEGEFMARCSPARDEAIALNEVLATRSAGNNAPPRPESMEKLRRDARQEALLRSLPLVPEWPEGQGSLVERLRALPLIPNSMAVATARVAEPSLRAADFSENVVDALSAHVTDNTFILADYGRALKALKERGRLHPGDEGYDAIRRMSELLGYGGIPDDQFTWSIAGAALEGFLATRAASYVTRRTQPYAAAASVLGALRLDNQAGRSLFIGATAGAVAGTAAVGGQAAAGGIVQTIKGWRSRAAEKWARPKEK